MMETIGRYEQGFIVKITNEEYEAFVRLADAWGGLPMQAYERKHILIADLSHPLAAVNEFASTKFVINQLAQLLNDMDKALTQRES